MRNRVAVLVNQVFAEEERKDNVQGGCYNEDKGQVGIQVLRKGSVSEKYQKIPAVTSTYNCTKVKRRGRDDAHGEEEGTKKWNKGRKGEER